MEKTACFIGHRKILKNQELIKKLEYIIKDLIINKGVKTFVFGSKSEFDDLCHNVVSSFKEKFDGIKRVYVRSSFENISCDYNAYLLKFYEQTIFPNCCKNAGKVSHIKRNEFMIDNSEICVFYYNSSYSPKNTFGLMVERKSGTQISVNYAKRKKRNIINCCD